MGMDRASDRSTHLPCPRHRLGKGNSDVIGIPAIRGDSDVDSPKTRILRGDMVAALVKERALTDEHWRQAFLAVPRHILVPTCYHGGECIGDKTDRERWLRLVYSDTTLITQCRPDAVTSSGTMPSLVAMMLQALEIEDGHRVLQVATGTGYTAALLCARLGSDQVTSLDIDPELTTAARNRLGRCGYAPFVITGDGAHGGLVKLTVTGHGNAQGPFIGAGYVMRHRSTPNASPGGWPIDLAEEPRWPQRITEIPSSVYYDNDFRFFLDLTIPGLAHGYRDGDPHNLVISEPGGSHAYITPEGDVSQSGPRRLWDNAENIYHTWSSLGAPPREHFGLTVTPHCQTIWLDTPDSDHRWLVG